LDEARSRIGMLNAKIAEQDKRNADTEEKLAKSTKLQNSISLLGINVEKHVYSVILFLIIAGVLVLAGFVFMLYKKSVSTTRTLKKDYEELKEEYEAHKKSALERYTQTNMELHRTRLELQKKK
jgi:Tfp pilus assembly protein PilO